MADREIERGTEKFLSRFAPLLEPNPRSLKRLINAYGLMRDVAILSPAIGVRMDLAGRSQLALWAIVSIRWPLLEELVASEPAIADVLVDPPAEAELTATLEKLGPKIPGDLLELLRSKQVQRVLNGQLEQVAVTLDADAVRRLRRVSRSGRHVE